MNVFLRPPPETPTRHRFTCEEFQRLGPNGYGAPRIVPADEPLACATIPGLSLRLDALDLPA